VISMTTHDIKNFAVKTIREELTAKHVNIKQVVLFGSNARQNASPDSDWDFLVCIEEEMPFLEKAKVINVIQRRLAEKRISADIIVKSEKKMNEERKNVGVITYYALKDGVLV